jgi:hypothetical protein
MYCLGRSSALLRDAAETMPMAGDLTRSLGRSPHFTCSRGNTCKLMQGSGIKLAIEG